MAVLIYCPHNCDYDGFCFWHPAKLIRDGRNKGAVSISYTDEFTFHLKKFGGGKHNKFDVIAEDEIDAQDFEMMFGAIDESITAPTIKSEYETHKPEKKEAEKTTALPELTDG